MSCTLLILELGQKRMFYDNLYNFPSLIMLQNVSVHCLNFIHKVVFLSSQIPVIFIDLGIFGLSCLKNNGVKEWGQKEIAC